MHYQKNFENTIHLLSNLFGISSMLLDHDGQVISEVITSPLPDLLQSYFSKMYSYAFSCTTKKEDAVTHIRTSYYLHFISFPIYFNHTLEGCMILGPFLVFDPSSIMIKEVMASLGISLTLQGTLREYYRSLTILDSYEIKARSDVMYALLQNSCHDLNASYEITVSNDPSADYTLLQPTQIKENKELYLDLVERRYANETEMLSAVEQGKVNSALYYLKEQSKLYSPGLRIPGNQIRAYRNSTITFNTLLRKAVENGGVHPIYADELSNKFSSQIEKISSIDEVHPLHVQMLIEYCDLVIHLASKQASPFVASVIEYVRLNLDGDVSLEQISKAVAASPSKISRTFKNEMGIGLSDYINQKRVDLAVSLIRDTQLSMTEIAYKVGFNDANYFSKVFRKFTGESPASCRKKYRDRN